MSFPTPPVTALALAGSLLGAMPAQAATSAISFTMPKTPASLSYAILMDGSPIGRENYTFQQQGGHTAVAVDTRTDVTVLFLKFHYRHQRKEDWQGNQLLDMTSNTDDDGSIHHVTAQDGTAGLHVVTDGDTQALPGDSLPLSLWNEAVLTRPVLYGVIDAEPSHVKIEDLGLATLTVGNHVWKTHHYRMSGDIDRELWYGDDGLLVQTTFERRGYPIKFVRQ